MGFFMHIVAIDVETANSDAGNICQVGITTIINGYITASTGFNVNPGDVEWNEYACGIHGIFPKDVKDAIGKTEAGKQISACLSDAKVVVHWAGSDPKHINALLDLAGAISPTWINLFPKVKTLWPELGEPVNREKKISFSLARVAERLNINLDNHLEM